MVITVQMAVSIGTLIKEIPTADSIVAIMDIITIPEKDRVVCHTKAENAQALRYFG